MSYLYNPRARERQPGSDRWASRPGWFTTTLLPHEHDIAAVNRNRCIRTLLGVDDDFFEYEVPASGGLGWTDD